MDSLSSTVVPTTVGLTTTVELSTTVGMNSTPESKQPSTPWLPAGQTDDEETGADGPRATDTDSGRAGISAGADGGAAAHSSWSTELAMPIHWVTSFPRSGVMSSGIMI